MIHWRRWDLLGQITSEPPPLAHTSMWCWWDIHQEPLSNTLITPLDASLVNQAAQTGQFITSPSISFLHLPNNTHTIKRNSHLGFHFIQTYFLSTFSSVFFTPVFHATFLPCLGSSLIGACQTQAGGHVSLSVHSSFSLPPCPRWDNRRSW